MSRFDEKLVCADSLAHHLKSYCGCSKVEVRRELNDPPDFSENGDGARYFDFFYQPFSRKTGSVPNGASLSLCSLIFDGIVTREIVKAAETSNVGFVVGTNSNVNNNDSKTVVLTAREL